MKDPFLQRLLMTVIAVGCFVGAAFLPAVKIELAMTATGLLSWAHLEKPGSGPQ